MRIKGTGAAGVPERGLRWRWRGMGGGAISIRSWVRCMRWPRRRGRWLYRGCSGVGYELFELWESGEAGDMAQLSAAIDGIAEAVWRWYSGDRRNVSLYNETKGREFIRLR